MTCDEVAAIEASKDPSECTRAERWAVLNHCVECPECLQKARKQAAEQEQANPALHALMCEASLRMIEADLAASDPEL